MSTSEQHLQFEPRTWVLEALFVVVLLELFLGGGGRLVVLGPGTLRMALFGVYTLIGLYALFAVRRVTGGQLLALNLLLAYLAVNLTGILVGSVHGADASDMLSDLQGSTFWLAAPFFGLMLQSRRMVERAGALVQLSGLLLAVAYIGVLVGTLFGLINGLAVFGRLNDSGEFIGRGGDGLFVYKGFIYLCIAAVFAVAIRGRWWKLRTLLLITALVLTLTRGFMLATSVSLMLMLIRQGRRTTVAIVLVLVAVIGLLLLQYLPAMAPGSNRDYGTSNTQRVDDMAYIASHMNFETIILGEGFGVPINDRASIENTFLWVFWKLGIVGILFWMSPLVLCTYYLDKLPRAQPDRLALAYYFGVVLVYIQTATNPYLNNPLGLSFVLLGLFSLRTMAMQPRAAIR
jgi:hypothetical protein